VTPEYNNSIPGVFKNAIDWLSRPSADISRVCGGKPVAIIGASPGGFGTILSQEAWLPVLRTLGTRPWFGGRLLVSRAATIFDESGRIVNEATKEQLREFIDGFVTSYGAFPAMTPDGGWQGIGRGASDTWLNPNLARNSIGSFSISILAPAAKCSGSSSGRHAGPRRAASCPQARTPRRKNNSQYKRMSPVDPTQCRSAPRMMACLKSESGIMHIPHELQDEFSGEASLIERLRKTNYEFRRLASRYEEVNRNIHRIESDEEPTADAVLEQLKKERLKLKDEIASFLTKIERRM